MPSESPNTSTNSSALSTDTQPTDIIKASDISGLPTAQTPAVPDNVSMASIAHGEVDTAEDAGSENAANRVVATTDTPPAVEGVSVKRKRTRLNIDWNKVQARLSAAEQPIAPAPPTPSDADVEAIVNNSSGSRDGLSSNPESADTPDNQTDPDMSSDGDVHTEFSDDEEDFPEPRVTVPDRNESAFSLLSSPEQDGTVRIHVRELMDKSRGLDKRLLQLEDKPVLSEQEQKEYREKRDAYADAFDVLDRIWRRNICDYFGISRRAPQEVRRSVDHLTDTIIANNGMSGQDYLEAFEQLQLEVRMSTNHENGWKYLADAGRNVAEGILNRLPGGVVVGESDFAATMRAKVFGRDYLLKDDGEDRLIKPVSRNENTKPLAAREHIGEEVTPLDTEYIQSRIDALGGMGHARMETLLEIAQEGFPGVLEYVKQPLATLDPKGVLSKEAVEQIGRKIDSLEESEVVRPVLERIYATQDAILPKVFGFATVTDMPEDVREAYYLLSKRLIFGFGEKGSIQEALIGNALNALPELQRGKFARLRKKHIEGVAAVRELHKAVRSDFARNHYFSVLDDRVLHTFLKPLVEEGKRYKVDSAPRMVQRVPVEFYGSVTHQLTKADIQEMAQELLPTLYMNEVALKIAETDEAFTTKIKERLESGGAEEDPRPALRKAAREEFDEVFGISTQASIGGITVYSPEIQTKANDNLSYTQDLPAVNFKPQVEQVADDTIKNLSWLDTMLTDMYTHNKLPVFGAVRPDAKTLFTLFPKSQGQHTGYTEEKRDKILGNFMVLQMQPGGKVVVLVPKHYAGKRTTLDNGEQVYSTVANFQKRFPKWFVEFMVVDGNEGEKITSKLGQDYSRRASDAKNIAALRDATSEADTLPEIPSVSPHTKELEAVHIDVYPGVAEAQPGYSSEVQIDTRSIRIIGTSSTGALPKETLFDRTIGRVVKRTPSDAMYVPRDKGVGVFETPPVPFPEGKGAGKIFDYLDTVNEAIRRKWVFSQAPNPFIGELRPKLNPIRPTHTVAYLVGSGEDQEVVIERSGDDLPYYIDAEGVHPLMRNIWAEELYTSGKISAAEADDLTQELSGITNEDELEQRMLRRALAHTSEKINALGESDMAEKERLRILQASLQGLLNTPIVNGRNVLLGPLESDIRPIPPTADKILKKSIQQENSIIRKAQRQAKKDRKMVREALPPHLKDLDRYASTLVHSEADLPRVMTRGVFPVASGGYILLSNAAPAIIAKAVIEVASFRDLPGEIVRQNKALGQDKSVGAAVLRVP